MHSLQLISKESICNAGNAEELQVQSLGQEDLLEKKMTTNSNSVTDAGVGALAARAAVIGAGMNVKINASSLTDRSVAEKLIAEANELVAKANAEEAEITAMVEEKIK